MNASLYPAARDAHARPAPSRARAKRIVLLLYAALAAQFAAWIAIAMHTGNVTSAFSQPHPRFPASLLAGGAIWLVQFALVVVLCHKRVLSRTGG